MPETETRKGARRQRGQACPIQKPGREHEGRQRGKLARYRNQEGSKEAQRVSLPETETRKEARRQRG